VEEVAPVLGGGMDPLVAGVKETGVAEVIEAAEGEMIEMMPGVYFFAFSKKTRNSERGRPRERAHLLPVDLLAIRVGERNGPLCTSLHGAALHQKDRVVRSIKRLVKLLQISLGHLHSLLGPQPDEDPREHVASQLEDLLDRNLVGLQQVNGGHERIIVRWQRRQRHPSMFYAIKETKTEE
jgi:hypothetical protein